MYLVAPLSEILVYVALVVQIVLLDVGKCWRLLKSLTFHAEVSLM